jgi:uncharacterized surface protein with fasciclin (FAS1) repeats
MTSFGRGALAGGFSLAALCGAPIAPARAEMTMEVGGAPMSPSKSILDNAVASKDHTILVAALSAAGLDETLQGAGPFTLFAPVNRAFEKMPKGAVDNLFKPENMATLTALLNYHVLSGKYSAADFVAAANNGGGTALFKTVQGDDLIVRHDGRKIELIDAKGGKSIVTIANVNQKNGVIHVVDSVLLPGS